MPFALLSLILRAHNINDAVCSISLRVQHSKRKFTSTQTSMFTNSISALVLPSLWLSSRCLVDVLSTLLVDAIVHFCNDITIFEAMCL